MLVYKGFRIDEEIAKEIAKDAQNDPDNPGNESVIARRIFREHYRDRLASPLSEDKIAHKSTSSDSAANPGGLPSDGSKARSPKAVAKTAQQHASTEASR